MMLGDHQRYMKLVQALAPSKPPISAVPKAVAPPPIGPRGK
jgi:hypothetical protein